MVKTFKVKFFDHITLFLRIKLKVFAYKFFERGFVNVPAQAVEYIPMILQIEHSI